MNMKIPADVPPRQRINYKRHWKKATQGTGKLMLFAGDQRVEHLHKDFYGKGIAKEDSSPEHFFTIASKARIGCFATQLGLISQYGKDYKKIPYVVKLNSKTNLLPTKQQDPYSKQWFTVEQIVQFKKQSKLNIVGVGYTIYLGSEFEAEMLHEAANIVFNAHQQGLLAIVWIYPRGQAIKQEKTQEIIAGAASVGAGLGADFVKVNPPEKKGKKNAKMLQEVTEAAGRTGVICAGGSQKDVKTFLQELHDQLHIGGTRGNATGRNIHQRPLKEAIALCNAISALTFDDATVPEAMRIYKS